MADNEQNQSEPKRKPAFCAICTRGGPGGKWLPRAKSCPDFIAQRAQRREELLRRERSTQGLIVWKEQLDGVDDGEQAQTAGLKDGNSAEGSDKQRPVAQEHEPEAEICAGEASKQALLALGAHLQTHPSRSDITKRDPKTHRKLLVPLDDIAESEMDTQRTHQRSVIRLLQRDCKREQRYAHRAALGGECASVRIGGVEVPESSIDPDELMSEGESEDLAGKVDWRAQAAVAEAERLAEKPIDMGKGRAVEEAWHVCLE